MYVGKTPLIRAYSSWRSNLWSETCKCRLCWNVINYIYQLNSDFLDTRHRVAVGLSGSVYRLWREVTLSNNNNNNNHHTPPPSNCCSVVPARLDWPPRVVNRFRPQSNQSLLQPSPKSSMRTWCPTHWSKRARPSPLFIHSSPVILPFCYCWILIHPLFFAPFFHITQLAWVPHHQSSHVLAHWCIQCPMPTITHIHHCFHNHIHICICIHIHVLIHTLTIALRLTTVPYMHSHTHFCILSVALWVLTHALVCTTLTHSLTFTFTHQHLYHDSQHLPALTKTHLVLVPSADIITVTWSQVHLTSSSCGWRVGGLDLGHFHWCWTVLVLFWWSLLLLLLPLSLYYLLWKLSCHWWLVFLWSSLVMVPGPQLIWPIGSVQLKDCS